MKLHTWFRQLLLLPAAFLLAGCYAKSAPLPALSSDLVVYTCLDTDISEPVIREFQERTDRIIEVKTGTVQELERLLQNNRISETCDVVFGISADALNQYREFWMPYQSPCADALSSEFHDPAYLWTGFSAVPSVILYNTRVVTYREVPTDWNSLLEPRWKGRIAMADPTVSPASAAALTSAANASDDPERYLTQLAENLDGMIFTEQEQVLKAISDGVCSVGICPESKAEQLRRQNLDIDYIYPADGTCLLPNGTAIVSGCAHPEAAAEFLDFTIRTDTQRILLSHMNQRSVRRDLPLPAGLPAADLLPLADMDYERFSVLQSRTLDTWNLLFTSPRGGDGT